MTADAWGGLELAPPPEDHMRDIDYEAAEQQLNADQFASKVAYEAERIRIRDAARRKVAADEAAANPTDYDALFLNRGALNNLPAPEPLIANTIPRHGYIIIRGRDGTFKTFVALDWALCLATGRPWQGHPVEQVPVLYIAGEGAHGISARVDAWERTWQTTVEPDTFTVRTEALNLHQPGPAFEHLLEHITAGAYGLVIVDTLRRVSGSADGNSSDMGAVVDNLTRIRHATTHGSVAVISHTDKGDRDSRGYSGIEDDADVVWHAKRDENNLTLENTKMKDGPDGHVHHLHAKSAHGSLILEAASRTAGTPIATEAQIKIVQTLREVFDEGAPGGKLLAASGVPETTFYRAMKELKDRRIVENTGTPNRTFYRLTDTASTPTDSQTTPTNGASL